MKKIIGLLLTFTLLTSCIISAGAANIGDVINKTVYTDIVAKINGYDIASYNIDGYTVVVAEDLRNYGFNVEWKGEERALYITVNPSQSTVTSTYVAPKVSTDMVGVKANDVLYTDIKTYMDGNLVTSYNIGGLTVISFNDLQRYGTVNYDNDARELSIALPWVTGADGTAPQAPGGTNGPPPQSSDGTSGPPPQAPDGTNGPPPQSSDGSAPQAPQTTTPYSTLANEIKTNGEFVEDSDGNYYFLYGEYTLDAGDVSLYAVYTVGKHISFLFSVESDVTIDIMIMIEEGGELSGALFEASQGSYELGVVYTYNNNGELVLKQSDHAELNETAEKMITASYEVFDEFLASMGASIKLKNFGIKY